MSSTAPRILAFTIGLFTALLGVPSIAQQPPQGQLEDPQRVARRKGEEALKLFGADRWEEARRLFREADKLYHAPTLVLYAARCERKLGMLLEARTTYERLISEVLPPNNPKAFLEAQETAKDELDKLRTRIPVVKILIKGVPPTAAKVKVDGSPVSVIEGNMTELNPGNHRIEATVDGANPFVRYFAVSEGGTKTIDLELHRNSTPLPPKAPVEDGASRGSLVPGGVALGFGVAGLAGGAVTGILSLGMISEIKQGCVGNRCLASDAKKGDSAKLLGNVSTAAFIAGGVVSAVGVVLLIVRPGGAKDDEPGPRVQAEIGPSSLRIRGTF